MKLANITGDRPALAEESVALLEALPEATLVVSAGGVVLFANKAARTMLGGEVVGQAIERLHAGDPGALGRFLDRCRGSATPLIGALVLQDGDRARTLQLRGSRLALAAEAAVLLRATHDEDRFSALTRQIAELNRQVRDRLHAEAVLAETLAERELLLSELQHRVKNNMHMLQGLLLGAQREASSEEARRSLRDLALRVSAINSVQQLLYDSADLASIGSTALVEAVTASVLALAERKIEATVECDPVEISIQSAAPLALVINELLTNAVKYGRPAEGDQRIAVRLSAAGRSVELTVQDNGPGFVLGAGARRASGTGLVKGLVRQLGGSFEVESQEGAKCVVKFQLPQSAAMKRAH